MIHATQEQKASFRALVTRTLVLPLVLLSLLSALFVAETLHLARLHRSVDHTDRVLSQVVRVQKLFLDSETGLRGYLLTGQPQFLEPFTDSQATVASALGALRALVAEDPLQVERVDRMQRQWEEWTRTALQRRNERERGREVTVPESFQGKALMDAIRAQVQAVSQDEEAARVERSREVEASSRSALWVMTILALGTGGFIAFVGRRQLVSLAGRYEQALGERLRQTALLQDQEWVNRGRALLGDEIRGDLGEETVAIRILSALARTVGAEVGVLYAVADDDARLELRAGFACAAGEAGPPATLPAGASWLGQVAREGKVARVSDLPPDHVKVASGTGSSSPRELVVAPLTAGGRTIAVVELGFLHPCDARSLELLAASAEPGGVALRSARYRTHLQELVASTQRQARDLEAQREELRAANRELEDQSRTLQATQTELETQQRQLETTNVQLEHQTAKLEAQRDDLVRAQSALVEKADQLAQANQYKSEFLANMSHELRTPLNSSLILAKLLSENRDGNLTPEQVRFAQTIHAAGNDLLDLINDILDLSRIEAGKLEVRPEPVRITALLDVLERTFQPMAAQKQLRFTANAAPEAPDVVETDPQRVQQVLKNLLSNAIKFTDEGEISLRVEADGPERVVFVVRDTGIGIAPADLDIIFEAFRQVDGSPHRQHGGTGLGLTISRDLARRLGGDVLVESTPGQGSVFRLVLPARLLPSVVAAAAAAAPGAPEDTAPSFPRPRAAEPRSAAPAFADDRDRLAPGRRTLLAIEDDLRFAQILYDIAHEQQFQCLVATTASEGFELARRHQPSGIVLDVNLPDGSGLSVLERLKRSGETRHIPIHVASVTDNAHRALEMGAIGYAVKPVGREALVEAIRKLADKSAQTKRHVLVVEDAEVQRDSLRALLQSEGVEITPVGTAADALERLRARTFDCMVLDLGLPDLSGHELLERMSADESLAFPPVIVYTGRALSKDDELRLRRHSKSVVVKGARSPERLLDEVTLFIHRVESSLPREQQRMLRAARNRDDALEGRRILIVEDDVRNVFALTSVLEPKGAKLEIARNGREALDCLARTSDGAAPVDLVLMDLMMPVMDGLTAIREIRARDTWKRLPIIALTAKAMADDREKCLEAGANDYIAKPLDVERLLSLVRVWMPK